MGGSAAVMPAFNPATMGMSANMGCDSAMASWLSGVLQNSDQDLLERIWPMSQTPWSWLLSRPPAREGGLIAKIINFLKKLLGIGEKGKAFADIFNEYAPSDDGRGFAPSAGPSAGGGGGMEIG